MHQVLKLNSSSKFGLLVNDVASVNIDSKLIRRDSSARSGTVDTLELQNGCMCCSLADDMMLSIRQFADMAVKKNAFYDHIILECSGIAEPRRIRDLFRDAVSLGNSGLSSVRLDTLATVIDAKVFHDLFGSDDSLDKHKALAVAEGAQGISQSPADTSDQALGMRSVTDLLLEQVECADVIIINKIDLLVDLKNDLERVKSIIQSINPIARIEICSHGLVADPFSVVGSAGGKGVCSMDVVQEHKKFVHAADENSAMDTFSSKSTDHACTDKCTDGHHDHTHDKHLHDHTHDHTHDKHLHDHTHDDHTHDKHHSTTTAATRFGISSYVYRRRRPFHPARFFSFLESLGEAGIQNVSSLSPKDKLRPSLGSIKVTMPMQNVLLRSKGFVWMSSSSGLGYYLSQAGQFLEMNVLGSD